jgi:hypothetical protein
VFPSRLSDSAWQSGLIMILMSANGSDCGLQGSPVTIVVPVVAVSIAQQIDGCDRILFFQAILLYQYRFASMLMSVSASS